MTDGVDSSRGRSKSNAALGELVTVSGERALVLQTGFLGDVVMATALFQPLADAGYEVYALVRPEHRALLAHDRALAEVITDDKRGTARGPAGLLRTARRLREKHFSVVLAPHRSVRTSLLLRLARIPVRITFDNAPLAGLFTHTVPFATDRHRLALNRSLLRPLGLDAPAAPMRLTVSETDRDAARALLGSRKDGSALVGVAPGSAWATKQWPAERFADALVALRRRRSFTAVLLGDQKDRVAGSVIAKRLREDVIDLTGRTTVGILAAIIEQLELLIANDSAPVHIAGAFRIPTVAVFLATHPSFGFGPVQQPYRIVQAEGLPCRPCSPHGGKRCPKGHFKCAWQLDPDQVALAAAELLAERAER